MDDRDRIRAESVSRRRWTRRSAFVLDDRTGLMKIEPWFGGEHIDVEPLHDTDKVAYSWSIPPTGPATAHMRWSQNHILTINYLLVWHLCDKNRWYMDPEKDQSKIEDYKGWHPAGVNLHTLVSVDPLHLEPSLFWNDCCGMHGWIREGRWYSE
jgi:hypothetical protein